MARRTRAAADTGTSAASDNSGPAAKQAKTSTVSAASVSASEVAQAAATDDETSSVTTAVALVSDAQLLPDEIAGLITKFALPPEYEVRYCDFCKQSSLADNPFVDHADCKAWGHQLPWGNGTREKPRGNLCRFEQVKLQTCCHYCVSVMVGIELNILVVHRLIDYRLGFSTHLID